jgi:hypothetical protein
MCSPTRRWISPAIPVSVVLMLRTLGARICLRLNASSSACVRCRQLRRPRARVRFSGNRDRDDGRATGISPGILPRPLT